VGDVEQAGHQPGVRASYHLRRTFLFVWRWQVERDGRPFRSGVAFSKVAARWAARNVIRRTRAGGTAPATREK
jgi:hypothetical protein